MIIGIDAGGSAIKFAGIKDGIVAFTRYEENGSRPQSNAVAEVLSEYGAGVKKLAVTGVYAAKCGLAAFGIPYDTVPEPTAIGRGGVFLSGEDDAVIVSLGTGTAFVLARNGVFTHLGGTGAGGGTLRGLGKKILGIDDIRKIDALSVGGELGRVDLTIGEMFSGSETLMPELTAANLAKPDYNASESDWALGLLNLILQSVGTMAMLSVRGFGAKAVVITGALASLSRAPGVFKRFEDCYGIKYIIADKPHCAAALGAALGAAM